MATAQLIRSRHVWAFWAAFVVLGSGTACHGSRSADESASAVSSTSVTEATALLPEDAEPIPARFLHLGDDVRLTRSAGFFPGLINHPAHWEQLWIRAFPGVPVPQTDFANHSLILLDDPRLEVDGVPSVYRSSAGIHVITTGHDIQSSSADTLPLRVIVVPRFVGPVMFTRVPPPSQ